MTSFSPFSYRLQLLRSLHEQLGKLIESDSLPEFNENPLTDKLGQLLPDLEQRDEEALYAAQQLISQLIANFPQLTPLVSRDLLWLLGGDCLHWMPDAEVEQYQQLEELYQDALVSNHEFDWVASRKALFEGKGKLH
ncbi:hypothetical protein MIB92_14600 [Aestuariirhabdus sp. Z084]|uniref:PA2817 family protein n=1 Tax=Aestuariirhabdus haliotis TaxID=2918751 RepID=UPI00201B38F4|nr:PA2817 family protein [Aestuariirhabdus haliotis]MCL6416888.1 hypothetical protein [Aestuariirhabdus haliotis]MCL6420893.1 hypothetical protein [Aestuariirhabdus haliotis]